jgi:hypothetical protein
MFLMLFFYLGENQNVVDENHDKLIQVLHEHLFHEIQEIGGDIRKSKGHHSILIGSIPGAKCCLGNIRLSNPQLVISRSQINFGENTGSLHLIK